MPDPFIVWAFQRTGGTTLFQLLGRFAGRGEAWFEPFNLANRGGFITKAFKESRDTDALRTAMDAFLSHGIPIKNCYELHPRPIHAHCFDIAQEKGFRHAVLDRRDDISRVFSRELAVLTGAWGKVQATDIYPAFLSGERQMPPMNIERCLRNLHNGMRRRRWLIGRMKKAGIEPEIVLFEEVYGTHDGEARLAQLCDYLGLPRGGAAYDAAVAEALHTKSQKSASLMSLVPNLDEARAALEEAGAGRNPWATLSDKRAAHAAG